MKIFGFILLTFVAVTSQAQSNWKSYNQNGYNLELPDYFLPVVSQDATVDVFVNSNNKDILLHVENISSDQLTFNSKYLSEIGNGGITYKLIKDSVYTVIFGENNIINYHKSFISNGQTHTLIISYPDKQKSQFDLILQRIGRSFK